MPTLIYELVTIHDVVGGLIKGPLRPFKDNKRVVYRSLFNWSDCLILIVDVVAAVYTMKDSNLVILILG